MSIPNYPKVIKDIQNRINFLRSSSEVAGAAEVLPAGSTAITQAGGDNSTLVATTAYVDTGLALKSNLASPTFTGTPTLPTGTIATTQTPANNSTAIATTAYVDAADALKANLASPAFTGTPSLPTGTTGVTQTPGDSSTKMATTAFIATSFATLASPTFTGTPTLPTGSIATTQSAGNSTTAIATTAFVTTADNLKANLASPTFTGTPTLPTGTIAVTQTAANNSTAVATTAYVDTGLALKANLASPSFSGTPTLPTGTIATTQAAGDSSTAIATTSFVTAMAPGKSSRVADTAAINTTETIITSISIGANVLLAGTTYRLTCYGTCTSTVANASNLRVRLGTAGSSGDAAIATITPTAATTGTAVPFCAEFLITIRTTGAGGTVAGNGTLWNSGVTGISASNQVVGTPTLGTAVNTTAVNILQISYVAAAATTTSTFNIATIELVKQ